MFWLVMLVLGGQGTLTPVIVRNASEMLTSDDYVSRAAGTGKSGFTVVEILIDPTGKPQTCGLVSTSGSKDLDLKACAAGVLRGKYAPATDETGSPMYGVYRMRVRWHMELFFDASTRTPKVPADIVLEVAKLPAGQKSVAVTLAYLVGEDGAIRRCSVITSSGSAPFDTGACSSMIKHYRYAPAKDKADKAWPVIRMQRIEFTSTKLG
jgi:TonB family protein